ncbi:putative cell survival pathways protein [Rhizina undulata]
MFSWVKNTAQSTLASVAGTAEPIYGPEAFHSVAKQEGSNPTYELTTEDLQWNILEATSAETQTFYLIADSGHTGMVQIIYSNVANIHLTVQFNCKVFYPDGKIMWSSKAVTNHWFDEEKLSFFADDLAVTLSETGDSYSIKSMVDKDVAVNLKISRLAPGFKVGKDGKSIYGTDPQYPWGAIRHVFWPRNSLEGTIVANGETLDFKGKAMYVMALQGMKPHHAAAQWNFVHFHGPIYSAVMMEFTTPPSYGSSVVNVCAIVKDGEVVTVSTKGTAEHTETKRDVEADWPEPSAVKFLWPGTTKDGKEVVATIEGPIGPRLDRVDVMAEVPQFVKKIVAGAAGTRPYIYQYIKKESLKLVIGEDIIKEEGELYAEATFISA